jgi:hypothetical protein
MDDDFLSSQISDLSDGQEIALSLLSIFSGTLSILGSSTIVYKVIKNRTKTTPYDRIMFGLSSCDIVASFSYASAPFLAPEETSQRVWAKGNDATCTFSGFLTQFAFSSIWYNCMLSFYYLLTVRFGVKRGVFAERYEFWIHLFTIFYFLGTASAGAAIGLYSEIQINQGCWVNAYPEGCEPLGNCISQYIGWAIAGAPTLFTFLAIPTNNVIIYFYVRNTLSEFLDPSELDDRSIMHRAQVREVASQGFLYVGTFMLSYAPVFAVRVMESLHYQPEDEGSIFPLLVLNNLLLPLQGFFNMFVYTRPSFVRVRAAFPEHSSFWALRKACLDSDIPRLTESRLSGSRHAAKPLRNSRKLGPNGFASDLSIVQEESHEDKETTAEFRATQMGSYSWAAGNKDDMEELNDMKSYNEDIGGTSGRPDCNTLGVDPSSERSEDTMELQASLEVFQPAGRSILRSRMGMDGLVSWY